LKGHNGNLGNSGLFDALNRTPGPKCATGGAKLSVTSLIDRSRKFSLFCVSLLLFVTIFSGRALAATVPCDDTKGQHLPAGDAATDLTVTGPCKVAAGRYTFHNVNIYTLPNAASGGSLDFDDATTDFYAENIVVENGGSLIAGSSATPIGDAGGRVTIHLWGKETDPGVTCQSSNCGVPDTIWSTNQRTMPPMLRPTADCTFSTLVPSLVNDCFYSYEALDPSDKDPTAYFGHKVLALSYGGTLQLFGKKGATYAGREKSICKEGDPSCTGTSWVRLLGSLKPGVRTLVVDGVVDWQDDDDIVITSTDYLPSHAEHLMVHGTPTVNGNTTTVEFTNPNTKVTGIQWPHNGDKFDLSKASYPDITRLGLNISSADTRASVGLLSHSIRIVSEGDTAPTAPTFATTFPPEPTDGSVGYFFGGHTIVRQGFLSYQVQGVEFRQLGQGGAIMHYPVHFHMARQTLAMGAKEPTTFVKDSSVWDSMTRWIVVHATQGVRLARNVGFESIGHGYYLEDGTETGNQLYANLGVLARAAVANNQNLRRVPGILTATDKACTKNDATCALGYDNFPFYSDSNHPAVFWIMNGMNDFQYNMAAGASTCGACYWFVPGAISGLSQTEKWYGYASEQLGSLPGTDPPFTDRGGTTPLQNFFGNSCSSAMEGFMEVGNSAVCNGVNQMDPALLKSKTSTLMMLPSDQATKNFPIPVPENDLYWPRVGGGGRLATRCSAVDQGGNISKVDCSQVPICADQARGTCDVVVLDNFTTNFNWAQNNFSAIWVRPFWSLVINSEIGDVLGGGLNFVTSGDFSKSAVISGFWALARKSAFIGGTQWQNPKSALSDNPYASNSGPFNPFVSKDGLAKGSACAPDINNNPNNSYCLSQDDGISIQLTGFGIAQRLFSVYDGPTYQDSNAYLNIRPTFLTKDGTVTGAVIDTNAGKCQPSDLTGNPCQFAGFMNGGNSGLRAYKPTGTPSSANRCYLPNAAIGWKQPNGFYYAPAFHSTNLLFSDVDIRHFVTEPHFQSGLFSFKTNLNQTKKEWCSWNDQYFAGFTDIDRETVLNDDDGTLTGLTSPVGPPTPTPTATATPVAANETISVNKETFFDAPTETTECASDVAANKTTDSRCPPATAKTSPYEYVTAAIFPECALSVPLPPPNTPVPPLRQCADKNWGSACSNPPGSGVGSGSCVGIPLYRQLRLPGEAQGLKQVKRMMGQNTFQRSGLTVNHGVYFIDTTVSKETQTKAGAESVNVFTAGGVYDLFFLYTKPGTKQIYQLFVGEKIPGSFDQTNVKFGYVDISTAKYTFHVANGGKLPSGWDSKYDSKGILTLTTDMSGIASDYDFNTITPNSNPAVTLGQQQCEPPTMCTWDSGKKGCLCDPKSPYFNLCNQKNPAGQTVCDWSVKDLDCPAKGCPAFQVTFPSSNFFMANDSNPRPASPMFGSKDDPSGFKWNVDFNLVGSSISGKQCNYTSQPQNLLCQKMGQ
jgi:hypothetical protein